MTTPSGAAPGSGPGDEALRTRVAARERAETVREATLAGLAPSGTSALWAQGPEHGLLPRLVFWIVGLLTAPFVLGGSLFVLFGSDGADRVFGIVLLVVFLPGLIALYRWAHPRL